MEIKKPILCLDFDGVCHSYNSGWAGADVIPDPPVDGLFDFLIKADIFFTIVVFSSRSHQDGGKDAMKEWFCDRAGDWAAEIEGQPENSAELVLRRIGDVIDRLQFPENKPPAMVSIDDRCILFTGKFPDPMDLLSFKPWNKM